MTWQDRDRELGFGGAVMTAVEHLELEVKVFVCSECRTSALGDSTRRGCGLPRGWEHYDPTACIECVWTGQRPGPEHARPVCGACVEQLLDALMAAMCRVGGAW